MLVKESAAIAILNIIIYNFAASKSKILSEPGPSKLQTQ